MKKPIAVLIILLAISLCAGETLTLLNFSTTNTARASADVVKELFRSELIEQGFSVIDDTIECKEIACAGEAARINSAAKAIYGSLIGMGEKIVVTMYVVRSDDEVEFIDRVTAESLEDLEHVVKRLVDSFISGKPIEETATIDNIVEKETLEPRRRQEFYTGGARIGFLFPFTGSEAESSQLFGYQVLGMYETDTWLVEVMAGYHGFDERESVLPIGISVFRLLSKKDICPYAGVGLGVMLLYQDECQCYSLYDSDCDCLHNHYELPVLSFGGGLLLFRTYSFHVNFDVRGYVAFGDKNYHGVSLSFGLTRRAASTGPSCCIGL